MTPFAPARPVVRPASVLDTARFVGGVLGPMVARGVIVRRPRTLNLLDRLDADRRAVALMRALRERYGPGPVRLRIPVRSVAVVLEPSDVARVLGGAPDPFHPANREKRSALRHFQPDGVLISEGGARERRRAFNELVLETPLPTHRLADRIRRVLDDELGAPLGAPLTWDVFAPAWWRAVRRITLGDAAGDDAWVTDTLRTLRRAANWAGLHPVRRRLRTRLLRRLSGYVRRAEPGSLAEPARAQAREGDSPADQIAHWLFAFDAAGMTVFRALALLSANGGGRSETDLRACVLETLRLWPTTPLILRDTTAPTDWDGRTLPAGTALLIVTPYLHRTAVPEPDAFRPQRWLDGTAGEGGAAVPFSAGPAQCPARNLVLLTAGAALATLLADGPRRLVGPHPERLAPDGPLPATLSPFRLRFA
jgi:cytochrome P450